MSAVIVGIHGLGNKPPYKTMMQWWIKSIREGFYAYEYPVYSFNFELVFWADIVHPALLDPKMKDKKDPAFESEPYVRAKSCELRHPNPVKMKMLDYLEKRMDKAFADARMSQKLETLSSVFIHKFFQDLEVYFSEKRIHDASAKELIKDRLICILRKYQGERILVIAHSMGTIVAYDVLKQLSNEFPIDTLVTIGSPLGLPFIKHKFLHSTGEILDQDSVVPAPEAIQKNWYNLSDLDDKVAVNYNLADDYTANSRGIGVTDLVVSNNYEIRGQKNHHKVFGYLRTPEMAKILCDFIGQDRSRIQKSVDRVLYHGGKLISGHGW
jgi:hypothetical protein